jgi:cell division protein FtsX
MILRIKKTHPGLAQELEGLSEREAAALIPESFVVSGNLTEEQLQTLQSQEGIERVESILSQGANSASAIRALLGLARLVGVSLLLAVVVILAQVVRIQFALLERARNVLKAWGAGYWRARTPELIAACSVGGVAGFSAWLGLFYSWRWAAVGLPAVSPLFAGLDLRVHGGLLLFILVLPVALSAMAVLGRRS